jgi:hypothetical protein
MGGANVDPILQKNAASFATDFLKFNRFKQTREFFYSSGMGERFTSEVKRRK